MKAIEQYFHVVHVITLLKVVLTFKFVDEILVCDQSNERYITFICYCLLWILNTVLYKVVL